MTVQHVFLELNQVYFRGQYTVIQSRPSWKISQTQAAEIFFSRCRSCSIPGLGGGGNLKKKKIQKDRKQNYWKLEQLLKFRSQFIAINVTESSHYPSMQEFSKKPKQSINEHGCYGYVFFCKADTMIKKKKIAATVNTENCCQWNPI